MSNRFAAGLSGIKQASGKAPAAPEPQEAAQAVPVVSAGQVPSRRGKVVISGYFDPAVRQQLGILAIKQNQSQAAMLAEAMNLLFEKYGGPPIAKA
jgi:hypothetical protein